MTSRKNRRAQTQTHADAQTPPPADLVVDPTPPPAPEATVEVPAPEAQPEPQAEAPAPEGEPEATVEVVELSASRSSFKYQVTYNGKTYPSAASALRAAGFGKEAGKKDGRLRRAVKLNHPKQVKFEGHTFGLWVEPVAVAVAPEAAPEVVEAAPEAPAT